MLSRLEDYCRLARDAAWAATDLAVNVGSKLADINDGSLPKSLVIVFTIGNGSEIGGGGGGGAQKPAFEHYRLICYLWLCLALFPANPTILFYRLVYRYDSACITTSYGIRLIADRGRSCTIRLIFKIRLPHWP